MLRELHAENDSFRLLLERSMRHQFRPAPRTADVLINVQLGIEDRNRQVAETLKRVTKVRLHQQKAQKPDRTARGRHATMAHSPSRLPRYEVVIDCRSRSKACPCCGGKMHCIDGTAHRKQHDIVPAQLRVRVARRPRATPAAPAGERRSSLQSAAQPIDGGMPTEEALVAHVVVSKY